MSLGAGFESLQLYPTLSSLILLPLGGKWWDQWASSFGCLLSCLLHQDKLFHFLILAIVFYYSNRKATSTSAKPACSHIPSSWKLMQNSSLVPEAARPLRSRCTHYNKSPLLHYAANISLVVFPLFALCDLLTASWNLVWQAHVTYRNKE